MTAACVLQSLFPSLLIWIMHFTSCSSEDPENATQSDEMDYTIPTLDYDAVDQLCEKSSNRHFRLWFMPIFYTIICFLGLAGNFLVILTVFHFKRLRTMTDVYLLNLSFADLLFSLSLPFWAANCMVNWVLGLALCKLMHTIYKVSFYSSMFLLSFISIDRYFAIAKAVTAHRHRSEAVSFSKVSSALIWLFSLIFSIPEMIYADVRSNTCDLFSSNNTQLQVSLRTTQIFLGFAFPLVIMSFCYTCIIRTLYQARGFERNKAIKVILAVVAVFLVSQVPYNLVLSLDTGSKTDICSYDNSLLYATDITQCLAFLRCCLNPFVYAFIGLKFRHDLLKLLKDHGCMSRERFYRYTHGRRRSSAGLDTETTTTLPPKSGVSSPKDHAADF